MPTTSLWKIILFIGSLIEIQYLFFVINQNNSKNIPEYMVVYATTFILMLIAYYFINKIKFVKRIEFKNDRVLILIIGFAVLFRLTLFFSEPSTSDDVYRYIWEGKLVANGFNPFEHAPDNEELISLHTEKYPELVTYKDMTTIYPTVAQIIFTGGYLITHESDLGLKIFYIIFEILTIIFLIRLLYIKKFNIYKVILYAWLPLPIMEYFINSHIDVVGIFFFISTIYYVEKDNIKIATPLLALGIATKLYPVLIVPLFIKKLGLKKFIYFSVSLLLLIAILLYPIVPTTLTGVESLTAYLSRWSFNGSIYTLLNSIINDGFLTRQITLVMFIISVGAISYIYKDFVKAAYWVWISFIIFASTLYPWYLGWISVLNPFYNYFSVTSLLFAVNLTNVTPLAEVWQEYTWVLLIQYIPFYIFLYIDIKNEKSC